MLWAFPNPADDPHCCKMPGPSNVDPRLPLQMSPQHERSREGLLNDHHLGTAVIAFLVICLCAQFVLTCMVEMGILPWPIGLTMTTHKNVRLYIHQQSDFRTPFIASRNTNRHKRGLTREVELCESTNRTDLQNSIRAHSHPDGIYGINTFLALSLNHAKALNKTSCWVCTHIPHSAVSGIPLLAISFQFNKWCGYWVRWMYRDKWDNNTKEWQEGWVDQVITDSTKKCLQR